MNEVGAWSWESGWIARDLHCGGWFPQSWSLDHHTNHSQLHQFRYCDSLTDVIMVIVYQSNGNVHFDTFRLSYHIRGLPFSCPRALLIPNPFDWNTKKGAHASSILLTKHNKIQNAKCGQKSRCVLSTWLKLSATSIFLTWLPSHISWAHRYSWLLLAKWYKYLIKIHVTVLRYKDNMSDSSFIMAAM